MTQNDNYIKSTDYDTIQNKYTGCLKSLPDFSLTSPIGTRQAFDMVPVFGLITFG